jgi:hypothetical protein
VTQRKLPGWAERRRQANIIEGEADCHVSNRWLQFGRIAQENHDGDGGFDELLFVDVMTKNHEGTPRKICELVLDRQELLAILSRMPVNVRSK